MTFALNMNDARREIANVLPDLKRRYEESKKTDWTSEYISDKTRICRCESALRIIDAVKSEFGTSYNPIVQFDINGIVGNSVPVIEIVLPNSKKDATLFESVNIATENGVKYGKVMLNAESAIRGLKYIHGIEKTHLDMEVNTGVVKSVRFTLNDIR